MITLEQRNKLLKGVANGLSINDILLSIDFINFNPNDIDDELKQQIQFIQDEYNNKKRDKLIEKVINKRPDLIINKTLQNNTSTIPRQIFDVHIVELPNKEVT